jgi:hypothetical protein
MMLLALFVLMQATGPQLPPATWGTAITLGGALLTSFLLSKAKKLDTSVTNSGVFRKVQPVITLGGAFLAPYLAQHLGVTIDPGSWAAAPLATVATIVGAELMAIGQRTK